jgi:two-component system cell cycle response regulator
MTARAITIEDVLDAPRIPTLPAIATEVLEMTMAAQVDLKEIARVIQMDQGLSARLLRTVNSSYYGLSRPCGTIGQAMVYLGLNTVKTLVLSFSLVDSLNDRGEDEGGFPYVDYWRRSIYSGVAARTLARKVGRWDPDEAFLAALMQDLGMIAMYRRLGLEYVKVVGASIQNHHRLVFLERDRWEMDHAEVGAEIAAKWKFSPRQVAAIRWHHDAQASELMYREEAKIVDLAGALAASLIDPSATRADRSFKARAQRWYMIDAKRAEALGFDAADDVDKVSSLLKLPLRSTSSVDTLRHSAEESLLAHHAQMGRREQELTDENRDLSAQVMTDPLTGVGSRHRFDERLAECWEVSVADASPLSVIFCDCDAFKRINDTIGHAAGDAALVAIAQAMTTIGGPPREVCRFGGDEFVAMLPGVSREQAAMFAEALRVHLESLQIQTSDGGHVAVTISAGVATFDGTKTIIQSPGDLVAAADQCMYAAKRSGCNTVRVFATASPTPTTISRCDADAA